MAGAEKTKGPVVGGNATYDRAKLDGGGPEWATGLKRLYDQVVDEPIPDSFMDLLSKLDDGSK